MKMGFVCTECKSFCEKIEDIFKDHLIREHSIEATHALSKVRNTEKRPIQSLEQGSKERYFPVFVPTIEELMETVEQRQPSTDVYMFGKEDSSQRIDEVNFISELLPNSLDPIKFDDAAFNKNADITDIEADVLELMGQTAKEPIFDQKALVQVPKDALVADRSNATVIARDSQFRRKQSKRELESVYATVRHSVNPTENVLEKEEISVEQEYFDNPLHDLASDMLVNVSKMVRESDFPRTLKFMGFKYLGSIATALCFSPSRMNSAIRKISRDKAHSVNCKSRSLSINRYQYLRISTVEPQSEILGKANTSAVKFLACIGSGIIEGNESLPFNSANHSQPIPDIPGKLPFMIIEMERRIQDKVKSYLRAATVTTKAAPNFKGSLVVAHNNVYSTVSSRRSFGAAIGRMDRRVGGVTENNIDENPDGATSVPRVNFFKVLNTSKSINDYGDVISRLVLMVSRTFLLKSFTNQCSKIEESNSQKDNHADGHLHDAMKNACAKLKETTGGVLSLEQYDSVEGAIATCLCSIGYCLHRRQSSLVQSIDSNDKGGSSTSD